MVGHYTDGELRVCLNCHGTVEFDAEDGLWEHVDGGEGCSRER
jgi:hypothetical protein